MGAKVDSLKLKRKQMPNKQVDNHALIINALRNRQWTTNFLLSLLFYYNSTT